MPEFMFCTNFPFQNPEFTHNAESQSKDSELNILQKKIEPVLEISNNVACATRKASDQPAYARSLIRAFASRLSILHVLSY